MKLEDITPGMLLAKDVSDPNGTPLIRAGAIITERHVRALKSWGIAEIAIQSDAPTPSALTRDSASVQELKTMLDIQFSLSNPDHPAVRALYEICLERALKHC
ncbi:hypothetical protein ThidrDRAFT_1701 [Thiorhodococcus drewsii AZ1]|uniref:Uncharacterized protein n=1 Tax=Thiorhodococcus drewsii AZ1 TaxID=765913 RepID=G2E088_9GAMM|nr:hypothetical protein [Thiorhodococcus drewsii]EGV31816.1 hypothetical protein ThidrDRAFT_1701 [Thiorhodococcus drewsii AZ1]